MERCDLQLGESPWERLGVGPLSGTLTWNDGLPLDVSVRIRGAHSRRFPKRSLQLDLKSAFLSDEPPQGHTVRRLHLNADYVDPTLIRSALSFRLFDRMGVAAPRCRHAALFLNGLFAGLYVALESVDRDFCRRRNLRAGPIFYAVNRNADFGLLSPFSRELKPSLELGYKAVGKADPAALRQMIMEINLASAEQFGGIVQRWVDVSGYLRWLIVAVFVGNRDGFVHNYALYLDPDRERFQLIPWDYDATWGIDIHGRPARLDRVPVTGWNRLTGRLMADKGYRQLYKRLFREALLGPLSLPRLLPEIEALRAAVEPWAHRDTAKLGTSASYRSDVDGLITWAEARRTLLLQELENL